MHALCSWPMWGKSSDRWRRLCYNFVRWREVAQLDKNSKYKSRANQMVHTGRDHNHGHHLFNGCDHYSDANLRQDDKATHELHASVKLQCSRRTKMLEVPHNDERLCKGLLKKKRTPRISLWIYQNLHIALLRFLFDLVPMHHRIAQKPS